MKNLTLTIAAMAVFTLAAACSTGSGDRLEMTERVDTIVPDTIAPETVAATVSPLQPLLDKASANEKLTADELNSYTAMIIESYNSNPPASAKEISNMTACISYLAGNPTDSGAKITKEQEDALTQIYTAMLRDLSRTQRRPSHIPADPPVVYIEQPQ